MAEVSTDKPRATTPQLDQFTVEFGDIYNRNPSLNTFRLRVRGSWSTYKLHQRPEGGRDVGEIMNRMPEVPGQRLTINVKKGTALLFDPLEDNPGLLDKVNATMRSGRIAAGSQRFTFVPRSEFACSADEMKTLLLELLVKQEERSITVVEGRLPTKEEVAALPGRQLADPWNNGRKPKYQDEMEDWARGIEVQV